MITSIQRAFYAILSNKKEKELCVCVYTCYMYVLYTEWIISYVLWVLFWT